MNTAAIGSENFTVKTHNGLLYGLTNSIVVECKTADKKSKEKVQVELEQIVSSHANSQIFCFAEITDFKLVRHLFERNFVIVGLTGIKPFEFVFLYAPKCKEIGRFFVSGDRQNQEAKYDRLCFLQADTRVPLSENDVLLPNCKSVLKGIFDWTGHPMQEKSTLGVMMEIDEKGRENLVLAFSRPPIIDK